MISGRHLSVLLTLKESYKRKEISLFKEVEGYRNVPFLSLTEDPFLMMVEK